MKALTIIQLCAREVNDVGYIRVGRDATSFTAQTNGPNWLDLLNDGQRTVALVRPDATATTESVALAAGSKQSLAAGRNRLLDVVRNTGADGLTPGRAIRFTDHATLRDTNPNWHTTADGAAVREVIYDDKKNPSIYYVFPPAAGKYIEIVAAVTPTDIADIDVETADISLPDLYAGPMQAWMLHRYYCMATQSQNQFQRAWQYFSSFFQQLGVKIRAEMFVAAAQPSAFPSQPVQQIQ